MTDTKKATQVHLLPEGRVINHSLFELDQYTPKKGQPGTPAYKVELAFDKGALNTIHDAMLDFANDTWGEGAENDVILPIKDGDAMAKKLEKLGKAGDAYKDRDVIRAKTIFNKHGEKGPGGIQVLNLDTSEIGPANRGEVYQGCFGVAAVTFSGYTDDKGGNAITCYLSAFQKTGEGERLFTAKDHSNLFKPVGRKPVEETEGEDASASSSGGRSRRKG